MNDFHSGLLDACLPRALKHPSAFASEDWVKVRFWARYLDSRGRGSNSVKVFPRLDATSGLGNNPRRDVQLLNPGAGGLKGGKESQ